MKSLLYKELKLVVPISFWLLTALFILLNLIPQYPKAVSLFYLISIYPLIFLGANKGTNNNDVYFSLTLPVSRQKIIAARMILLTIIQGIFLLGSIVFIPIGYLIERSIIPVEVVVGLGYHGLLAFLGFAFVAFGILDFVFIPLFYRTAKSFTLPFVTGIIAYSLFIGIFMIALPAGISSYNVFFNTWKPLNQVLTLVIGIIIFIVFKLGAYILANKLFSKVDI